MPAVRLEAVPVAVTALSPDGRRISGQADVAAMAVVIGSEGQGVRPGDPGGGGPDELIIPMNPHCESLNAAVAAAIVMWQMQKSIMKRSDERCWLLLALASRCCKDIDDRDKDEPWCGISRTRRTIFCADKQTRRAADT